MAIPSQVLDAEKKVDDYFEKQGTPEEEPEEKVEPTEEPEGETTEEQPGPSLEAPEEKEEPVKDADYWKQRFKVMEGKVKSEIPALMRQVDTLTGHNAELSQILGDLQRKVEEKEQPKVGKEALTDEEKEALEELGFDDNVLNIIGKVFKNPSVDKIDVIDRELKEIKGNVHQDASHRFYAELDNPSNGVSDWNDLDKDPQFVSYLSNNVIPYTSTPIRRVWDQAIKALDSKTVISIMSDFKKGTRKETPTVTSPRKKVVEPSRGKAVSVSTASAPGKVWKLAEIKSFYKDAALGRKYSDEDYKKIDKEIWQAQLEGRVTQ